MAFEYFKVNTLVMQKRHIEDLKPVIPRQRSDVGSLLMFNYGRLPRA